MTLIVEDGSKVPNANSYVNLPYARQYASDVGLTLPADDVQAAAALGGAMSYIEGQALRYQGHRANSDQWLEWPRNLVKIGGYGVASNAIPELLKHAQVTAAAMIAAGTDFYPTIDGQFITKEKVGPIETEYSDEYLATADGKTAFSAVDILLGPLFIYNSGYRLSPAFGF